MEAFAAAKLIADGVHYSLQALVIMAVVVLLVRTFSTATEDALRVPLFRHRGHTGDSAFSK